MAVFGFKSKRATTKENVDPLPGKKDENPDDAEH